MISNMEMMLRRLIGEAVELELDLAPELEKIEADPGQIEQVVLNLAANGRDAMPLGGRLSFATRNTVVDEKNSRDHSDVAPDKYVTLSITDTGKGMDTETRERIFDPFFTTKEFGKGTGLGLATVYGIVKQHNGYINVASNPEKGATFTLYFPCTSKEAESAPAEYTDDRDLWGEETILVVEDEIPVRNLLSKTLRNYH